MARRLTTAIARGRSDARIARRRDRVARVPALAARVAGILALVLLSASGAVAADGPIQVDLLVSRLSKDPGPIDPRAAKLDAQLRGEFRYESLSVVQAKTLRLGIDDVGGLTLPSGKKVRVRPLLVDDHGALLAVEVEGSVQTDLRVRSDQIVIIGTERDQRGKLVISLEPHFETPGKDR